MKKIFKYELSPNRTGILTHDNAKFLSVQVQKQTPCVWIEIDTDEELVHYSIYIIPTGAELPNEDKLTYIGTFQYNNGDLVFHVYIKDSK